MSNDEQFACPPATSALSATCTCYMLWVSDLPALHLARKIDWRDTPMQMETMLLHLPLPPDLHKARLYIDRFVLAALKEKSHISSYCWGWGWSSCAISIPIILCDLRQDSCSFVTACHSE